MSYESYEIVHSQIHPVVSFKINRMSFGRRLELMRRVRDMAPKLEYFQAGDSHQDKIEASLLSAEIDRLYLEWGLTAVDGLEIDGEPATPFLLAHAGPEELFREALQNVKRLAHLSEAERKN